MKNKTVGIAHAEYVNEDVAKGIYQEVAELKAVLDIVSQLSNAKARRIVAYVLRYVEDKEEKNDLQL